MNSKNLVAQQSTGNKKTGYHHVSDAEQKFWEDCQKWKNGNHV